ncbi:hypothetical protein D9619_009851 [Psilocybe cf. subviscida]|uniref:NACHT domain-containing protein n=1 Tax=Psilocybe cf. subviscida TaxID=2480587 RepID=A0A8H5F6H7_9AGAR|nr:hypothetical protein D9619_009851 [Psilocybe cf. subviscida]
MTEATLGDSRPRGSGFGRSMFHQASNTKIYGGDFHMHEHTHGVGGMDNKQRIREALALLNSRAEHGAPYDAAAREDVPKCRERTRVAVIDGIHKWAHSQESDAHPFMWMYGPAGCGKTTIMQTVAEIFNEEDCLATSFFFSKLSAARPTEKTNFIITIAYQLSLCILPLEQPLADALSNPSILTKSLAKQLDALVIGPLKMLDPAQVGGPRCIVLIDGLDECTGDAAQRDVLDLLEQFWRQTHHRIRILVASRPLSPIQAFFSRASIRRITRTIALDNKYEPDEDIRRFILSEFGKIREEHPARRGLPSNWPTDSNVTTLVRRASGQFIYASVVMKYIADHGRHPHNSLQTIISLKTSGNERPYQQLDALYTEILSSIEPQNLAYVQDIIGCLLIDTDFHFSRAVQKGVPWEDHAIDFLFMVQPGTTDKSVKHWECCRYLLIMLSKAPLSLELAAVLEDLLQVPKDCLIQEIHISNASVQIEEAPLSLVAAVLKGPLQVPKDCLIQESHIGNVSRQIEPEEFFISICLYLFYAAI